MPTPITYGVTGPGQLQVFPFAPGHFQNQPFIFSVVPTGTLDINVVPEALAQIAEEYKHQPKIASFISLMVGELQKLEYVFDDLLRRRSLAVAQGAQLDLIGKILGLLRQGFSDSDYRNLLQAKILVDSSSGTIEQIYAIFELIEPPGATLTLLNYFPAGFILVIGGAPLTGNQPSIFLSFMRKARDAGVKGILQYSELPPSGTFTFDGAGPGFELGGWASAKY